MALMPLHPCNKIGCGNLTRTAYCELHKRSRAPDTRPSAHQRGYTYQWSKASKTYLSDHPWCAICLKEKSAHTPAVLVDHIIPHKGNMALFWDESNWQSACKRCHDIKTAREDGGFGNRK